MGVQMTGFDALLKDIQDAPGKLDRELLLISRKLAEAVAGRARAGAPVRQGRLRNSIQSYVENRGSVIEGGARTSYPPAVYQELGTGPVGDEHPHPADGELGITRRPDGWTYWSDEVAAEREPRKNGEPNGFVFTRGTPAKAFLYNALVATEDEITASLGEAALEVFVNK